MFRPERHTVVDQARYYKRRDLKSGSFGRVIHAHDLRHGEEVSSLP
jgi:hypothetical protein